MSIHLPGTVAVSSITAEWAEHCLHMYKNQQVINNCTLLTCLDPSTTGWSSLVWSRTTSTRSKGDAIVAWRQNNC